MSNKQPSDVEPLTHEQKIGQWYQQMNADTKQQPSSTLDTTILDVAKKVAQKSVKNNALQKTLGENSSAKSDNYEVTKLGETPSVGENRPRSKWYRHLSLAASVAILGVLFFSQYEFFVSPEIALRQPLPLNQPAEVQEVSSPISQMPTMQESKAVELASRKRQLYQSEQTRRKASEQVMVLNQAPAKLPLNARLNAPEVLEEKMFDNALLAENSAKTQPMSLFEMSKLAEVLRLDLATHQVTGKKVTKAEIKVIEMQRTLFEHLWVYQHAHPQYKIEQKFLTVLTLNQVKQLTSASVGHELNNTSELEN